MSDTIAVIMSIKPVLAPPLEAAFEPAALWMQRFAREARAATSLELCLALSRPDGSCFRHSMPVLPSTTKDAAARNFQAVERTVKMLLWMKGASKIELACHSADATQATSEVAEELAQELARCYSPQGARAFDDEVVGQKIFRQSLELRSSSFADLPPENDRSTPLGRHLDGCRIGFDLGGSDRKAAALIDGKVVFSEEIAWQPYFENDPAYHYRGIKDSIERAAKHLPRLDAIGGSAAGVYVDKEPRAASLFRGISDEDFEREIRPLFRRLQQDFGDVPFELVNDGEVTALAASMSLDCNAILGISMGTSQAAGYVDAEGHITNWLNELAFCPIDFRPEAPCDEWSGDVGCGVQYFSQQGVARLAKVAGIPLPEEMPFAERLLEVQTLMEKGDERAQQVFASIGRDLGWTIPWYAEFYDLHQLLILGRVTSGAGGELIIAEAQTVLEKQFPELAQQIALTTPDETMKRHGQAIAAASLPALGAG